MDSVAHVLPLFLYLDKGRMEAELQMWVLSRVVGKQCRLQLGLGRKLDGLTLKRIKCKTYDTVL